MRFTLSSAAAILAFTSTTIASPLQSRQTTYKDFQVTKVDVSSASSRPGGNEWTTMAVTVTDPNEYEIRPGVIVPASTVTCNARFSYKNNVLPTGRGWSCDPTTQGSWLMELLPGTGGEFNVDNDFNVKLTHTSIVYENDVGFTKKMAGEGNFNRPGNMAGTCSAGGAGCLWKLKEENTPTLLKAVDVTWS